MLVAIAGGGGFVGLAIAEALINAKAHVRLVDINPPPEAALHYLGERGMLGSVEVQVADVTNGPAATKALEGVDRVVLAAAVTSAAEREREQPRQTLDTNVLGFTSLLEAARAAGADRVVNLSSASAYGAAGFEGEGPLTEDGTWPKPDTLYGVTKLASEGIARRLATLWDTDIISVRLSAVFGPWERDTGRRDTLSPHMQAAKLMLEGETAILPRACSRDWTDSRQVARAVMGVLTAETLSHPLYNISCGTQWTMSEWVAALAKARPTLDWRMADPGEIANVDAHGDLDRHALSCERLKSDLGLDLWLSAEDSAAAFLEWRDQIPGYWAG
ncbi:MAG: NAD-dependent epimerase/dehydratase family protein [Alphaproteobacteria bacterium]|jgi:nucleoside-diphosphate-sugar epimerase